MKSISMTTTTLTGVALLVLWGASWAISAVDLGAWSIVIALGIAGIKAALVMLFFMEIIVESASIHAVVFTGFVMIAILMSFMVLDVATRATPPLQPTIPSTG